MTGKEKEEHISEQVKPGNIQRTKKCKYLGITIGDKSEEIRLYLKPFEICFMAALIYAIEAWGYIKKDEMKKIERIQGKTLKRIFKLPLNAIYTGTLMETRV